MAQASRRLRASPSPTPGAEWAASKAGVERVESWVERFLERRMAFLAEPDSGRPRRDDEDGDEEE